MDPERQVERIQELTGASHMFSSAVDELVERSLEEASSHQLTLSQVKLLLLISPPGKRFRVMDVAEFLGVTNAAASRSIDRLVQRGLVDRTVTPEDRRAVDLSLTPRASALLERFTEVRNRELLRRLGKQSAAKLERATALLDELSLLLVDPDDHTGERCLRCGIHFRQECLLKDVEGRECVVANSVAGVEHDDAVAAAGGR
jgi:DNA-binding MarR family transcriptional regulator